MPVTLNLYLDDSGTRHPARKVGKVAAHGHDWFALGGIMIRSDEEEEARRQHASFIERWRLPAPLHSSEIRSMKDDYEFLRGWSKQQQADFLEELYLLMRDIPAVGIACVIDRPGYNARYFDLYRKSPWLLCKTAFVVVVERAAKHARAINAKLRVLPERCNRAEDQRLAGYYQSLMDEGMPFSRDTSDRYAPLSDREFRETLYEFRLKQKTSPMAQLADLYLWPMCIGGYHGANRTYSRMVADGKLIDSRLSATELPVLGVKYSCFDAVHRLP